MEVNVVWWLLLFALMCLYLGFSREKYASTFFGILAGGGLICVGYAIMTRLSFVGFGTINVITYSLDSDAYLGTGHVVIGGLFALAGVAVIVFSLLLALWGEQRELGDVSKGL